jgi:hypothetical protein
VKKRKKNPQNDGSSSKRKKIETVLPITVNSQQREAWQTERKYIPPPPSPNLTFL